MTNPLTDDQIKRIFTNFLSSSNGWRCERRLIENGVKGTERICNGESIVKNGKLFVENGCGEPCTFICKDSAKLAQNIQTIMVYADVIDAVRKP